MNLHYVAEFHSWSDLPAGWSGEWRAFNSASTKTPPSSESLIPCDYCGQSYRAIRFEGGCPSCGGYAPAALHRIAGWVCGMDETMRNPTAWMPQARRVHEGEDIIPEPGPTPHQVRKAQLEQIYRAISEGRLPPSTLSNIFEDDPLGYTSSLLRLFRSILPSRYADDLHSKCRYLGGGKFVVPWDAPFAESTLRSLFRDGHLKSFDVDFPVQARFSL